MSTGSMGWTLVYRTPTTYKTYLHRRSKAPRGLETLHRHCGMLKTHLKPKRPAVSADDDLFHQMETFVFMDFETTGLIENDESDQPKNHPMPGDKHRDTERALRELIATTPTKDLPYITEMSFVTAPRSLILNEIDKMKERHEADSSGSVAVRIACNVHTRQVRPPFSELQWREYEKKRTTVEAMKLSRSDLEDKSTFAEEWPGVLHVLQTCKKPACLVAHNGVRFDFRVLYAELDRNNLFREGQQIPDQVYFLDSYFTFMDLEKEYHGDCRNAANLMDFSRISRNSFPVKEELGTTEQGALTTSVDPEKTPPPEDMAPPPTVERLTRSAPQGAKRRLFEEHLTPDNPLNFMRSDQWSPAKKRRLADAKELFVRKQNGDWRFDDGASCQYFRKRGMFKLDCLFKQLTNNNYDAHFAQDDCVALLQISILYGRDFVNYADNFSKELPY
uniref:Exonuclease domain-containing protein n=1 Tax=Steinernema glaseri TaxID=37863 RepID=A0A1I7YVB6_9BILA